MIQITAQMRVLVAIESVDGRKGIDSLVRLCQDRLAEDPFSGCVFVFRSRSGAAIRLLTYDGQGYWLAQKRLSKGRFVRWPEVTNDEVRGITTRRPRMTRQRFNKIEVTPKRTDHDNTAESLLKFQSLPSAPFAPRPRSGGPTWRRQFRRHAPNGRRRSRCAGCPGRRGE